MDTSEVKIENSGAQINDANISAEQFAGRDIVYNYSPEDPAFAAVDLSFYGSDKYLSPTISEEALAHVSKHRILLITGGNSFDKGSFIRHLGFRLQEEHKLGTRELEMNEDNTSLYQVIRKGPSETVYLLDRLHPQHVDYDLHRLQQVAEAGSAYILMTTDLSISVWQFNDLAHKAFCLNIPQDSLYEKEQLSDYIKEQLKLKKSVHIKSEDNPLFSKESLESMAIRLGSPENINLFVNQIPDQQEITAKELELLIQATIDSSQSIVSKWYMTLSGKEKLIALGAALLDGAYDDQFFSMINAITDKMWKYSHESLQALDYRDLDFLSDYFRFENLGGGRYVLQSKYLAQRVDIIKNAWQIYRRHLLCILPIFVSTAKNSLNTGSTDWENFGTRQKRANLRLLMGQTISEIGMVSIFSVENVLIELAANSDDRITRIAAKSLAQWREYEQDEKLFGLLQSWLNDDRPRKIITEYLSRRVGMMQNEAYHKRALSYLRASTVLTLSYAANYDSPNKLNEQIISLLLSVMKERNEAVVNKAIQTAIPRLVHHHVLQLKDVLLEEFMKYDDMVAPIAEGLKKAYSDYPEDLKSTLDRWFEQCMDQASKKNRRGKLTHRDKVLVTVLEFYSKLEFSEDSPESISLDEVYKKLVQLSDSEGRSHVRNQIFKTLGCLLAHDWKKAEAYIPLALKYLDLRDAAPLIDSLFNIFLEERQELKGNEYFFTREGIDYPIWLDLYNRPRTPLETRLTTWVDSTETVLQQLATLSFLKIAEKFELEERDHILEIIELQRQRPAWQAPSANAATSASRAPEPEDYSISLFARIRIFFLLFFESKESKATLKSILLILYRYRTYKREYKGQLNLMLRKWTQLESGNLKKLSRWLRKLM